METKKLTDLVTKARSGDEEAINELYEEFMPTIYSVACMNVQRKEDAEDIAQETFLTILQKLNTLKSPEAFPSWMKMIVINKCRSFHRKKKEYLLDEDEDKDVDFESLYNTESGEFSDIVPDQNLDRKATADIVGKMISSLSEKHKTVLMMFYYRNMSIADISAELSINAGTVKSRLSYARTYIEKAVLSLEKTGVKLYSNSVLADLPSLVEAMAENVTLPQSLTYFGQSLSSFSSVMLQSTANAVSTGVANSVSTTGSAAVSSAVSTKVTVVTAAVISLAVGTGIVVVSDNNQKPAQAAVNDTKPAVVMDQSSTAEESADDIFGVTTVSAASEEPSALTELAETVSRSESGSGSAAESSAPVVQRKTDRVYENGYVDRYVDKEHDGMYYEDGLWYVLDDKTKTATVSDMANQYGRFDKIFFIPNKSTYFGKYTGYKRIYVDVPKNVHGDYTVTAIGNRALPYANVVNLPDSITAIGEKAFYNCPELEEIRFGNNLETVGDYSFYNCLDLGVSGDESIKVIGESAFENCNLVKGTFLVDSVEPTEKELVEGVDYTIEDRVIRSTYDNDYDDDPLFKNASHIGSRAFAYSGLELVKLGGNIQNIYPDSYEFASISHMILYKDFSINNIQKTHYVKPYIEGGVGQLSIEYTSDGHNVPNVGNSLGDITIILDETPMPKDKFAARVRDNLINSATAKVSCIKVASSVEVISAEFLDLLRDGKKDTFDGTLEFRNDTNIKQIGDIQVNSVDELKEISMIWDDTFTIDYGQALANMSRYDAQTKVYTIGNEDKDILLYSTTGAPLEVRNFVVSDNNPYYVLKDGVLFSRDEKQIISYTSGAEYREYYKIPDNVRTVSYNSFRYANCGTVVMTDNSKYYVIGCFVGSTVKNYAFSDSMAYNTIKQMGIGVQGIRNKSEITFYCNNGSDAYKYAKAEGFTTRPLSEIPVQ